MRLDLKIQVKPAAYAMAFEPFISFSFLFAIRTMEVQTDAVLSHMKSAFWIRIDTYLVTERGGVTMPRNVSDIILVCRSRNYWLDCRGCVGVSAGVAWHGKVAFQVRQTRAPSPNLNTPTRQSRLVSKSRPTKNFLPS